MSGDLTTFSAITLAQMIRDRKVSSREVVDAHIDKARTVNPTINAIVADRYDAAQREADAVDAGASQSSAQPLAGVPFTVKESFGLTGMPNTAGLVSRKGRLAQRDATIVARLRDAGAVPIGVTNTSELCMWMESDNRVYGRTNNPYDPSRIVGGSSGGRRRDHWRGRLTVWRGR